MDLGLKDKVIMVAGASKGLGFSTAKIAAQEGALVSIGSRNPETIRAAGEAIASGTGARVEAFELDMSDGESINSWVDRTLAAFGRIDGVFVNAGGPPAGTFADFDDSGWQDAFELTLLSAVRLIRRAAEAMKKNGGGSILTLTSISVKEPVPNLILSNVMRSGVVSLVKTISREFAPYGIRVNNIIPGFFDTERLKNLDAITAEAQGKDIQEVKKNRQSAVPLERYGDPDELGRSAVFLLSPAASYVTGHSYVIDGGLLHGTM
ncbi:MAG TPA: SDR family oxidoreductase [Sediminispirochaeta sp.]|mgnify:CR=1 FL=1|nr:SDR family oxidoreductase [Sediminispirochaeta sp.]